VTSDEGKASTVAEPPLLLSVFFMLPHALHQEKEQAHQYYYSVHCISIKIPNVNAYLACI
jgi:hypothetical protein